MVKFGRAKDKNVFCTGNFGRRLKAAFVKLEIFLREKAVLIERWIDDYMGKLSDLGYRGQFFNIELWHTPNDEIILTEINPRAAHSYHWNYLYSFGTSLYEDNIALGEFFDP